MDFKVLEKASETLQDKLRLDESAPDLAEQFTSREQGSHRYYLEPYRSNWGPLMEYGDFLAFPKLILDQYMKIECASFMGLLPELNRVWVTVDNKLFLWKYVESAGGAGPEAATTDNCEVFDGMSEVIVSVALSAPRPGVFLDSVKYVLAVASPVEVALLAVTCDENGGNFRLLPTAYKMPSDNVAMVKVMGSQSGRIFMAGNDGNVYELDYSNSDSVWSSLVDGGEGGRHKCRKINHFAWNWRLVHLLPPFLKSLANEEDSMVDLAVDNVRHVVYAVTARGMLSAFYLGASGSETTLFQPAFNLLEAARNYLSGYAAEGAPRPEAFAPSTPGCTVLSLSVLSPIESRKVHLVATLQNGIRVYLSLRSSSGGSFAQIPPPLATQGNFAAPGSLQVVYVRSPPPPAAVRAAVHSGAAGATAAGATASAAGGMGGASGTDMENGCVPLFIPSQALRVSAALSTQAVTLLALDKQQHPDEVLCLFEDLVSRTHVALGLPPAHQPPSVREGVCVGVDESQNGGKVYDLQEDTSSIHSMEASRLRALFALSATPPNSAIRDGSHHHDSSSRSLSAASDAAVVRSAGGVAAWLDGPATASSHTPSAEVPVALGGRALHMACRGPGSGFDQFDLGNAALLSELAWQHMPCVTVATCRHFLVLTNQGVHFLRKLRPADVLYRCLSQLNAQGDEKCRQFFSCFGSLEASAMCVALACGLPGDAGSAPAAAFTQRSTGWRSPEAIQARAMSVMLGMTQGPIYKSVGAGLTPAASAALRDSRMVISSAANDFVHSSAHDALYLVCGRILRPLWLRSIVRREGGGGDSLTSTWSLQVITNVRGPLSELHKVLKGYFATAVVNSQQGQEKFLALLADRSADDLVTSQMLAQAQASVNAERLIMQQARSVDDASIHALYRLVARALQALSLIEVLVSVKDTVRVQWAKLSDVSFRSLVVSARTHDSVKLLANSLVSEMMSSKGPDAMQAVVDWLSRECPFYFSPGDRCSVAAARLLAVLREDIKRVPVGAGVDSLQWAHVQEQAQRCVQLLLCAAKYWRTVGSVTGDDSPLWQRCAALLSLETVGQDGVVDLCLAAADNFAAEEDVARGPHQSGVLPVGDSEGLVGWEAALYRETVTLGEAERRSAQDACFQCLVQHILTVGSDVRRLGAGILPTRLPSGEVGNPLEAAQSAMRRMMVRTMTKSTSARLHALLGERLLRDFEEVLLSVKTPSVEQFLASKDPLLLYKYYERHGDYVKASALMGALARDEGDCDIAVRVSYLQRAVASGERAVATAKDGVEAHALKESLSENADTLEIAGLQSQAAISLAEQFASYGYTSAANKSRFSEGQRRSLDLLERAVARAQARLLTITELFHEICTPYKLWDICLLILGASKHEDAELIARLWLSVIYRLVPDSANTEEGQAFLRVRRGGDRVEIDKRQQFSSAPFEQSASWLPSLRAHVVRLVQQLGKGGATVPEKNPAPTAINVPAFPSAVILEELEELVATLTSIGMDGADGGLDGAAEFKVDSAQLPERGWSVTCFVDVGFAYGTLVETLVEILGHWQGNAPEKVLHILSSTSFALMHWTRLAATLSARNEASTRQLMQAARSGRVAAWLEKLRRQLSTLGARRVSAASQQTISEVGKELAEVNRRVVELTVG